VEIRASFSHQNPRANGQFLKFWPK